MKKLTALEKVSLTLNIIFGAVIVILAIFQLIGSCESTKAIKDHDRKEQAERNYFRNLYMGRDSFSVKMEYELCEAIKDSKYNCPLKISRDLSKLKYIEDPNIKTFIEVNLELEHYDKECNNTNIQWRKQVIVNAYKKIITIPTSVSGSPRPLAKAPDESFFEASKKCYEKVKNKLK